MGMIAGGLKQRTTDRRTARAPIVTGIALAYRTFRASHAIGSSRRAYSVFMGGLS